MPRPTARFAGTCPACGKRCYVSRRHARAAARVIDPAMSAYRCGGYWHLGHLPEAVRRGRRTRTEHYRRRLGGAA
jgi:hypothetical protein